MQVDTNLLLDNVVRQTTVLIAQLATSGGLRAPLAHVANQVFLDLTQELESQGLSKRVTADMFGMALRSYRRRIQRLAASATDRDRSLWEAILGYLSGPNLVTREEVFRRFLRDDEDQVRSVLRDLCDSGLIVRLTTGKTVAYRATTPEEVSQLSGGGEGQEELVWVTVYREGPLTLDELGRILRLGAEPLKEYLERLEGAERVRFLADGRVESAHAVMPLGSAKGWEAAIYDHFQAVVRTLCSRLRALDEPKAASEVGGSTYGFNVWPGHPYEKEVRGVLSEFREKHTRLRELVQRHNSQQQLPDAYTEVVVYGGQYLAEHHAEDERA